MNPREAALQALAELLGQLEFNHFPVSLGGDEGAHHSKDLTKRFGKTAVQTISLKKIIPILFAAMAAS